MASQPLVVYIDGDRVPIVLAAIRKELADTVRRVALDEPPAVAKRLRQIAAAFESGQKEI